MNKVKWSLILLVLQLSALPPVYAQSDPIKVALYADDGTGPSRDNVANALSDTSLFDVTLVMGADVRAGILQNFDVFISPGGSGSGQAESLEESGRDSVRAFVSRGGGYLGICAGSYLASSDYSWSLNLLNTKVIDKAHWARGNGPVDVRFNNFGRELFELDEDTIVIEYRQGALMAPAHLSTLPGYIEAGVFESEIAENGAPSGVMIGTTAFAFSVYGEGRAAAFSPHPEITTGREYMIATAVEWLASDDPFLAFVSPREYEGWEAGSVRTIEWISESGDEPVLIEFSPDDGATWELVASGQVDPYDWTVPEDTSEECLMRIESLNDPSLADTMPFSIDPPPPSIVSLHGGNWSDPGTWEGNVVPDSTDNVVIGPGHTVIVDAAAHCLDISFADAAGRLSMQADLRIYGNFNRFDTSVNPFYSGSNLWSSGARMIFTGNAEIQTITNLGTTSASPYPVRFQHIVIDKYDGKFTTQPIEGLESNYKLGIGVTLEIINGTFELGRADDIEGRNTSGTATTPDIIVHENGFFKMLGSFSHIRRGNFIGDDSAKIGKLTVYGEAYLANSSTNRINMTGIDVEAGGVLTVPYYIAGGNMGVNCFNPGTFTIKDGGTFINDMNTNYWYDNPTTPNQIALLEGGTIESRASAPYFPVPTINQGTFVYSRSSSDQTVFDMDYHNLQLRNSTSGAKKIWTLGADRVVAGELNNCYSAESAILADEAHTLTIQGTLRLTSGEVDNSDTDVSLTMGDGVLIRRIVGTLLTAPVFAGSVDVEYASENSQVTTGPELPIATDVLNDLEIDAPQGVILGADVTVNGTCTDSEGDLTTGSYTVTLGPAATLVESDGNTIIGRVTISRTVNQASNETFGGIGLELSAAGGAPGATTVSRVTGSALVIGSEDGIKRYFNISPANNSGLDATVIFHYDPSELNSIPENELYLYSTPDGGATWYPHISSVDDATNRVTALGMDILSTLTLGSRDNTVPCLLKAFTATANDKGIEVSWALSELDGNADFLIFRKLEAATEYEPLAVKVEATGKLSYRFIDTSCRPDNSYRYRVDLTAEEGPRNLFETEALSTKLVIRGLVLFQNSPNPFNPSTRIRYNVPERAHVTLIIYDASGRRVTQLVGKVEEIGIHELTWNGRNDLGNPVTSGVYFYRLTAGGKSITRKMVFVK